MLKGSCGQGVVPAEGSHCREEDMDRIVVISGKEEDEDEDEEEREREKELNEMKGIGKIQKNWI